MATSSTSSTLGSSDETLNGPKLMRLILDEGTEALRIVFKTIHPGNLQPTLSSNKTTLSKLKSRKVLNKIQWDTLYPTPPRLPNINNFDITLLSILLRSICGLTPPTTGWDRMPNKLDCSVEADVVRIKLFRNDRFAHIPESSFPADDFKKIWADISLPIVRLGVDQGKIDRLENEKFGPDEIAQVLKEWNDFDEKIFNELSEIKNTLKDVKNDVQKQGQNELQSNSALNKLLVHFDFKREIQFYLSEYVSYTRQWVLEQVTEWFHNENSEHRAFVISSPAGMGKSVVAAVICDMFQKNMAYCHFIQYNNSQYNNPNFLLQSLAWHLCQFFPAYRVAVVEKLSGNLGKPLNEMSIEGLFATLLKELLTDIEVPKRRLLIVLDAVDESEYCGKYELANLIVNHFHKLPAYIRFVITARPEKKLLDKFSRLNPLYIGLDDERNLNDIKLVLQNNLPSACPPDVHTRLAEKCSGLMLYAYFLTQVYQGENFDESQTSLPGGIDEYYETYLHRLEHELRLLEISNDQFLSFLSVLAVAQEPMPEAFIGSLFQFQRNLGTKQKVRDSVNSLSSLFLIEEDKSISFFHKSVRDWLVNNDNHRYCIDMKRSHDVLFHLCLEELKNLKQKSIACDLPTDVALKYALKYCTVHLLEGNIDKQKMECFVTDYVTDLQVMFASVHFDIDLTVNNNYMLTKHDCFQSLSESAKFTLHKLILLIRKSRPILYSYPQTFLQSVVNEGGEELSLKASSLLQTRYKNLVYLDSFYKPEKGGIDDLCCYLSGKLMSVDISPNRDYAVCLYDENEIELFSLSTGRSEWRKKICVHSLASLPVDGFPAPFYYRPVVFHSFEKLILPGKLNKGLTFKGTITTCPFQGVESDSEFIHCCFSSDGRKMATLRYTNCNKYILTVWNVLSGSKETCVPCRYPTSFSFTASGNYLGAIDIHGEFKICDLTRDYEVRSRQIQNTEEYAFPKIITSSGYNSWICCYCHYPLPQFFHFQTKVIVLNSDFSEYLAGSSYFINTLHVPSTADVSNKGIDEYLFSVARQHLLNQLGWPYKDCFNYLLTDEKTFTVFSSEHSSMCIVSHESLRTNKSEKKLSKQIKSFSAISNNGDVVYLSGSSGESLSICHVRSENRYLKSFKYAKLISLVVVKSGVVLFKDDGTLELWNNDLTKLLSSLDELTGAQKCLSVSDEVIACVVSRSIVFFDVITQKITYKMGQFLVADHSVIACSVSYHVLIDRCTHVELRKNGRKIKNWHDFFKEAVLQSDDNFQFVEAAQFSPDGDKLVFFSERFNRNMLHIFNFYHDTIKFLGKIPIHGECIDRCWLSFFGKEKLVCCRKTMTYLIEVERAKILTCLDVGDIPDSMSVCQERQLICLGYESLEKFKIIRICCQR